MPKFSIRFQLPSLYFPMAVRKIIWLMMTLLIVTSVSVVTWRWYADLAVPVSLAADSRVRERGYIAAWMEPVWREVLFGGVPMLREMTSPQAPVTVKSIKPARSFVSTLSLLLVNVDIKDPRTFLTAQIPLLNRWPLPVTSTVAVMPNFPKFTAVNNFANGEPLVGIYHTHTSEAYVLSFGKTHAPGGQKGDIVNVGAALADSLQQKGITALHNQAVHDYPSFMKAYAPSELSAKKMLTEHQSIQMLFDIHRDADKRENTTISIGGEEVARIRIVVAIGQPDLPQPYWQQNHAFAKVIEAKMNELYPGLSRGILLADWRYNQHLHPRALLLEVGAQDNSCEEGNRSMKLLANILSEIIRENQ